MFLSATYITKAASGRKSRWTISQEYEWQVKRFERTGWLEKELAKRGESKVWEEDQGDADSDQERTQEEDETYAEEEADGTVAFVSGVFGRKDGRRGFAIVQEGAEKSEIRDEPEFYFVARLPQQVHPGADYQQADDAEKLGHG